MSRHSSSSSIGLVLVSSKRAFRRVSLICGGKTMVIYVLVVIAAIFIYFKYVRSSPQDYELLAPYYKDKCWTVAKEVFDTQIYPFKVDIEDSRIADLQKRLQSTRLPLPSLKDSKFHYGVNSKFMTDMLEYWKNSFDWKTQECELNKFPQFKTKIEGLDIHFLHLKPPTKSLANQPKPLILVHGWPGSYFEFYKIIPMLTDPTSHGGNETDLFEVIVPSIPGYGFSQASEIKGFNSVHCARVFHKLMTRLGHKKYYAQGGDWGSFITTNMSMLYPNYVLGLHVNMNGYGYQPMTIAKLILGSIAPSFFFNKVDVEKFYPLKDIVLYNALETGYMHIQATKPDTVGYALSDSPVGLAAYIFEKFSTWTDLSGRDQDDGDILKHWTYDELLTNIMIYWWSGNISSSMRFYKENIEGLGPTSKIKIRVPAGFAWFPNEFVHTMKSSVELKYTRLLSFTRMKSGGHFAAFECPQLLVDDIRNFVRLQGREDIREILKDKESLQEFRQTHLDSISKKD